MSFSDVLCTFHEGTLEHNDGSETALEANTAFSWQRDPNSVHKVKPKTLIKDESDSNITDICTAETGANIGCRLEQRQIHTDEITQKPGFGQHKCSVCGKLCQTASDLIRHLCIHTAEKPFRCDICGKLSQTASNLIRHIRIHTGEKPFKCNVCGMSFSVTSTLKTHYRLHTGEKPFSCSICRQSYASQAARNSHFRTCARKASGAGRKTKQSGSKK